MEVLFLTRRPFFFFKSSPPSQLHARKSTPIASRSHEPPATPRLCQQKQKTRTTHQEQHAKRVRYLATTPSYSSTLLTTPKYARESMPTRLPMPTPSAPPEPPSPMMRVTMGTVSPAITVKLVAIASLCPSLSACCGGGVVCSRSQKSSNRLKHSLKKQRPAEGSVDSVETLTEYSLRTEQSTQRKGRDAACNIHPSTALGALLILRVVWPVATVGK